MTSHAGLRLGLMGWLWLLVCAPLAHAVQEPELGHDALRAGHWVEAKGYLQEDGRFRVQELLLLSAEDGDEEALVGPLRELGKDGDRVRVLGQEVHLDGDTDWQRDRSSEGSETRVKVQGRYRGPRKFSANQVRYRRKGRDQITGRVDAVRPVAGGSELRIMRFTLFLPADEGVQLDEDLESVEEAKLAPARPYSSLEELPDDDDDIPGRYELGEGLTLGVRLEVSSAMEDNFDLDDERARDRRDDGLALRSELVWTPGGNFQGLLGFRHSLRRRLDQDDPDETTNRSLFNEAWGRWSDVGTRGLDVQLGRQDFDEPREWIYDQNLDAARVRYRHSAFDLELSASTVLAGGGPRDEATNNLIAYLSNGDEDRHLAAYVVDRRDGRGDRDYPLHLGLRALGEWLPRQDVWAELSLLRGYTGTQDLHAHAFDLGTTWHPAGAEDWYLTAGYAFGSGDDNPSDGTSRDFRQTGLHDNNGRFGGVTSFRYYGELVDPDLSNLSVLTLGVGRRFGRRRSLDLVLHHYAQDQLRDTLTGTDLRRRPDGLHDDLGWELDLIYGDRARRNLDLELVLGVFEPGDAFPGADTAFLAKLQLRFAL